MSETKALSLEDALKRLFTEQASPNASWITLPVGCVLFSEKEPSDHLYLVQSGRLGVFHSHEDGSAPTLFGIIKPGEPVGEMSLIAGTAHTTTVMALRDTELLALPRDDFIHAVETVPDILLALSRKMMLRARAPQGYLSSEHTKPNVFAFIGLNSFDLRSMIEKLAQQIETKGQKVKILDHNWLGKSVDHFAKIEDSQDYVFYIVEKGQTPWGLLAARQVDHCFYMASTDEPPLVAGKFAAYAQQAAELGLQARSDLILVHPPGQVISGTSQWLDVIRPKRFFHIYQDSDTDMARLVRLITATTVGLVFSGGGARAYAHIGAIRALREADVPIDFICGSSMGAIVGACLALMWDMSMIDQHIEQAFVHSSPLDDVAMPFLAMTQGKKVDQRLKTHFGEVLIEDLPLPFFCLSSNLTTGDIKTHRTGPLVNALRASISLPGLLPPVIMDNHVLVDGAVMRPFPAGMMRAEHLGSVVGVDVTRAKGLDPKSLEIPENLSSWMMKGHWRKGPPIVSVLMRSATITTAQELAISRQACDLLVIPEPEGVEIRDWRAYEEATQSGYQTTKAALAQLSVPVTQLRALGLHYHPNIPAFTPDDDYVTKPVATVKPKPVTKSKPLEITQHARQKTGPTLSDSLNLNIFKPKKKT